MVQLIKPEFTAHLALDHVPVETWCGAPWDFWQKPHGAKTWYVGRIPRPHVDAIYFCEMCRNGVQYHPVDRTVGNIHEQNASLS